MGIEADSSGYFEGPDFVIVESCKFELGEYVSYYGVSRIVKVEIVQYRTREGSTIKHNRDAPYYHVINVETDVRNQEFNSTLKNDRLANLLYR